MKHFSRTAFQRARDFIQTRAQPLKVVTRPDAPGADLIADVLQLNLGHLIDSLSPAGCWEPVWDWSGRYPEDWAVARQEWCGVLTLEALTALRSFGRLTPINP